MGWLRQYKSSVLMLLAIFFLSGCHAAGEPRMRFGAYFGSPTKMKFPEPAELGRHNSKHAFNETKGMLYTCKAGFIDLGHVREGADRAAYLQRIIYQNLIRKKTEFNYKIIEPSRYYIKISYPQNWGNLTASEREKTATEVSMHVGQYLAHTGMIWHEILSWFGFATVVIFPDTISAFSCEDSYSDVMGTAIGIAAVREKNLSYDDAVTKVLNEKLKELDVQPSHTAEKAAKYVRGQWYKGGMYFFVNVKAHNLDVGLDDGSIAPFLVPGICPGTVPENYPVPTAAALREYGFKIEVRMDPRVPQKHKIYESIGLDKQSMIIPEVHFPLLMKYIEIKDTAKTAKGKR